MTFLLAGGLVLSNIKFVRKTHFVSPLIGILLFIPPAQPKAMLELHFQQLKGGVINMKQKIQEKVEEKVVSLELSAVKIKQFNEQPSVQSSVSLSKDKRWLIHRTVITDIKPVSYMEKVLASA